ncbi:MAG: hypothetical protein RBU37_07710 [Myxococcota bacterium]|jgi:hypothetical protein|nr:hypothetical protein [Myxococcota bacterium]
MARIPHTSLLVLVVCSLGSGSLGCSDDLLMLLTTSSEPIGENCLYGGVRIETGRDNNQNRKLDADEVEQTSYACNARVDGLTSLTRLEPIEEGDLCEYGGLELLYGLDRDEDRVLSPQEIDSRGHVCRGDDGFDSLVTLTNLPPDPNGDCYFGGTRIDAGLDVDRDGTLSRQEVLETQIVCSIHVNENMTLVRNEVENPGVNCEYGGIKVSVGYDEDGDGQLETVEVQHTGYVCNQIVLVEGKSSLIRIEDAGAACEAGGYRMSVGLDVNYDGELGPNEIRAVGVVCNGTHGISTLLSASVFSGTECAAGTGVRWSSGRDLDYDGTLDPEEIEHSEVVCDGETGIDGVNSLVDLDTNPTSCDAGGFIFRVGLDEDEDGYLSDAEITDSTTICFE